MKAHAGSQLSGVSSEGNCPSGTIIDAATMQALLKETPAGLGPRQQEVAPGRNGRGRPYHADNEAPIVRLFVWMDAAAVFPGRRGACDAVLRA